MRRCRPRNESRLWAPTLIYGIQGIRGAIVGGGIMGGRGAIVRGVIMWGTTLGIGRGITCCIIRGTAAVVGGAVTAGVAAEAVEGDTGIVVGGAVTSDGNDVGLLAAPRSMVWVDRVDE